MFTGSDRYRQSYDSGFQSGYDSEAYDHYGSGHSSGDFQEYSYGNGPYRSRSHSSGSRRDDYRSSRSSGHGTPQERHFHDDSLLFKNKTGGKLWTIFYMWIALWGIANECGMFPSYLSISSVLRFGMILALFLLIFAHGLRKMFRFRRFKAYRSRLRGKDIINLSELADEVDKTEDYVRKDIKYMIQNEWFRQAHLDQSGHTLIISDEAYRAYVNIERQKKMHEYEQAEAAAKKAAAEKAAAQEAAAREAAAQEAAAKSKEAAEQSEESKADPASSLTEEERTALARGRNYIDQIRTYGDNISNRDVKKKVETMEQVLLNIYDRVEQHPEMSGQVRKLNDYYLPTTLKLLTTYWELQKRTFASGQTRDSMKEIEGSLNELNVGYQKILDLLYQDQAWDVSSDISVLKMMMAQDGLKAGDFEK